VKKRVNTKTKSILLISLVCVSLAIGGVWVVSARNEMQNNGNGEECGIFRGILRQVRLGRRHGWGRLGRLEVSEGYKENAVQIAENDEAVQALLDEGYSTIRVRPMVRARVGPEGKIDAESTDARVILGKEDTGRAIIWVNLEEGKVTKIIILNSTVIVK
jgi:hypothetical protein